MVGSPFILINKNGKRTLLNTAQITTVSDHDILLTDAVRRVLWAFPAECEMAYMVRVEQADGAMDFMFTKKEERDELLDKIIAAISPSAAINGAPGLPHTWPELARMGPPPRYVLEGKEYTTFEEYWKAWQEDSHQKALAHVNAMAQHRAAAADDISTPPTPKPLRKPYTRKPRE